MPAVAGLKVTVMTPLATEIELLKSKSMPRPDLPFAERVMGNGAAESCGGPERLGLIVPNGIAQLVLAADRSLQIVATEWCRQRASRALREMISVWYRH